MNIACVISQKHLFIVFQGYPSGRLPRYARNDISTSYAAEKSDAL